MGFIKKKLEERCIAMPNFKIMNRLSVINVRLNR